MLISLVMVCKQVVDAFEESRQGAAIVLLLQQEFLLRKYLNQVDQAIASFAAQLLCVGCQVSNYGYYGLVDGLEESWTRLNQLKN